MKLWFRIESAFRNLLHKSLVESELDAEIRAYVDATTDEKIAKGIPADGGATPGTGRVRRNGTGEASGEGGPRGHRH